MSDLLNRANEIEKENNRLNLERLQQQKARENEQNALKELSKNRLREFFDLMKSHNIPTEDFLSDEWIKKFLSSDKKRIIHHHQGWVIKDSIWETGDGGCYYEDGFMMHENMTIGKWRWSNYVTNNKVKFISSANYDWVNTFFGTDEGLNTLSRQLAKLRITR